MSESVTISGSEAPLACGVGRDSRLTLWARKLGLLDLPEETEAMRAGQLLHAHVVPQLLEARGYELLPGLAREAPPLVSAEHPWMTGHPDAFTALDGERAVVEIKTGARWAREIADPLPPLPWAIQATHYLVVTGLRRALLAYLHGTQLVTWQWELDPEHAALIVDREREFCRLVEEGIEPAASGSDEDARLLAALHAQGHHHVCSPEEAAAVREYRRLHAQRISLASEEKRQRQTLLQLTGGPGALVYAGAVLAEVSLVPGQRSISYVELEQAHPRIAARLAHQGEPYLRLQLREEEGA